jgi:hypothetical protein
MAQRAVKSDYFQTGEEIARQRRKDVPMNTEIKRDDAAAKTKKNAK